MNQMDEIMKVQEELTQALFNFMRDANANDLQSAAADWNHVEEQEGLLYQLGVDDEGREEIRELALSEAVRKFRA